MPFAADCEPKKPDLKSRSSPVGGAKSYKKNGREQNLFRMQRTSVSFPRLLWLPKHIACAPCSLKEAKMG